jgi:hypothetical protein
MQGCIQPDWGYQLEVFIWRHVVYVQKSTTAFRGILIWFLGPGICKNKLILESHVILYVFVYNLIEVISNEPSKSFRSILNNNSNLFCYDIEKYIYFFNINSPIDAVKFSNKIQLFPNQHVHLAHVLMRLCSIDKSFACLQSERMTSCCTLNEDATNINFIVFGSTYIFSRRYWSQHRDTLLLNNFKLGILSWITWKSECGQSSILGNYFKNLDPSPVGCTSNSATPIFGEENGNI